MSEERRKSIFLADPHVLVRAGLKALIDQLPDMKVVGEAADRDEALRLIGKLRPDIVVVDVSLPPADGAITRKLNELFPESSVVALNVVGDIADFFLHRDAGASGYVLKSSPVDELITALRRVADGATYVDGAIPATIKYAAGLRRGPADLSEREAHVLRAIANGHSNKEIAARMQLSVKTIETYKARAMGKMGFRKLADLVRHAVQRGWLADPPIEIQEQ
jgi:DNA-binding NarL/FixJ family response regulator